MIVNGWPAAVAIGGGAVAVGYCGIADDDHCAGEVESAADTIAEHT